MEEIGVLEATEHMANIKRALKNRIGRAPVQGDDLGFYAKCPECGTRAVLPNRQKYCTECGSRMLWEQYRWARGFIKPDSGKTPMQQMFEAWDQKEIEPKEKDIELLEAVMDEKNSETKKSRMQQSEERMKRDGKESNDHM